MLTTTINSRAVFWIMEEKTEQRQEEVHMWQREEAVQQILRL